MKIVSWNCNGALRHKLHAIDQLDADILIIQECENPKNKSEEYRKWAGHYIWHGTDNNKGIGIFAKNNNSISALDWGGEFTISGLKRSHTSLTWLSSELKLFLPIRVNNEFNILGVWTKGNRDGSFGYMGQFWKYLRINDDNLQLSDTIIIGDFNSNSIWDKSDRWWNHSSVIDELFELNFLSLYHHFRNEQQGKETQPTFYLQRNENKSYHIDYAFVSKSILEKCQIEVGDKNKWLATSDHMPIIITLI